MVDTVSACGVQMFFDNVLSLLNSYVCWLWIYVYFVCLAFTCRHLVLNIECLIKLQRASIFCLLTDCCLCKLVIFALFAAHIVQYPKKPAKLIVLSIISKNTIQSSYLYFWITLHVLKSSEHTYKSMKI